MIDCCALMIRWVKRYPSNRLQTIQVNGVSSLWIVVDFGAPGGSAVEASMFVIYIYFILRKILEIETCKFAAYADEISLIFPIRKENVGSDLHATASHPEECIKIFEKLGLRVDPSNIELVLFRSKRNFSVPEDLRIHWSSIPLSDSAKCLGVTLHQALSWRLHQNDTARNGTVPT